MNYNKPLRSNPLLHRDPNQYNMIGMEEEEEEKSSRNTTNKMFLRLPTITNNTISSTMSSKSGNSDDGFPTPSSDSPNRQITEWETRPRNMPSDDNVNDVVDQRAMELFSKRRQQQEEILLLRKQIADAGLKELHVLNEKYTLEKKTSDLRMALDEKQNDAIKSASKELAHRKGDLDENIKLIHELKAVEDDRLIFTSAMLRLLDEYEILPHVINASSISSNIKHLYDQLQWKIRTSHASIVEINYMLEGQTRDRPYNKEKQPRGGSKAQLLEIETSTIPNVSFPYNHIQEPQMGRTSIPMQYYPSETDKEFESQGTRTPFGNSTDSYYPPNMTEDHYFSEGEGTLPGIEGFQILGDAKPGNTLRACGFPVRGTALCMFQWVRHLHNGTGQYIEGATNPDYVVTADDVDKFIAVDCIPMDDKGCQGELVRLFANNQKKITCDPDMQMEIETHLSEGQATFDVLLWKDTSGVWEPRILILKRYSYQIKNVDDVVFEEHYSADLSIQIPCGLTTQFVLTCSDRSSHPFSTHNDVRMRDTLVLTLRSFQSKAIDDKRKGKA
ncbi:uncharacterized protein LOC113297394 isoform X3 [Papaver somniferum]|uniref:uncharacterized protein LOC113297394 isoform X3 n=1 Tax=Papaver somniferum TaxID=3469 RepID=UPI000E6F5EFF|nr:uncharacterized protein LOC113297394 isoform X3 [Papaver somniferum]